jgi:hypothetical protein
LARKSIHSQEGTEGCLTKPEVNVAASSWGLELAESGLCPEPWAQPKKIVMRWNPPEGYKISGCWEPKRKFRSICCQGAGKREPDRLVAF